MSTQLNQEYGMKLLAKIVDVMNLGFWNIDLEVLSVKAYNKETRGVFKWETNGCTFISQKEQCARILIRDDLTLETFITTLIHECAHLILSDYDDFVTNTIRYATSKKVGKALCGEAEGFTENVVHRITRIVRDLIRKDLD